LEQGYGSAASAGVQAGNQLEDTAADQMENWMVLVLHLLG
jgi:hypothetical protein